MPVFPIRCPVGKWWSKAEINGKQGNFIFDTGAPVCLTYSFALGLELETLGKVRCQDSNGSLVDNRVVMLNCFGWEELILWVFRE